MENLVFHYHLKIEFSEPVKNHRFTVKCIPQSDERQIVEEKEVKIFPNESLCESKDSFGNCCVFGNTDMPHSRFEVEVKGHVRTGLSDCTKARAKHQISIFRYQTRHTNPGKQLKQFFDEIDFRQCRTNLEKSHMIMQKLYENFSYVKGVTTIETTAEEAWKLRKGVCQDYAHIMISLCRMAGISSRYVVGMLMGEGLSHAWVEIEDGGYWYGLDPTNLLDVKDEHIKISHGRDYRDCMINQGLFAGNTTQQQTISVVVEKYKEN